MPTKRTHPELVQQQIDRSKLDLKRISTTTPFVDTDTGRIPSVLNPNQSIVYRETYIIESQTRCSNFDPLISGFERGEKHGWCALSNITSDPTGTPGIHSHDWRDARHKWLRLDNTPRCLMGELTTCSGYRVVDYYVPHPKQFRSTSATVQQDFVVSDRGEILRSMTPQYYMGMWSVEVRQTRDAPIPVAISTAESFGVFISGHQSMSSHRAPNNSLRHLITIPKNEWVRFDFLYYNPVTTGRVNFGHNLIDNIDGWRTPSLPAMVNPFYVTFARRDPGSLAKWSYVMALIKPTSQPQNDLGVVSVDVDWRAPSIQYNQWRRSNIPVNVDNPTAHISGLFRVPHSQTIEIRSRAVNVNGDFSDWHIPSGLFSAAGNLKPGTIDNVPPVKYTLDVGVGNFEFDVQSSRHEEWSEYILLSGHGHDPHVTNAGIYQLLSPNNPGDMIIDLIGAPPFITSGLLCSIDGGYELDSGELHLCNGVVPGAAHRLRLLEPLTKGYNQFTPVKFYQVAKRSNDDVFSLPKHDTQTWFFNMVGRNYNGGISPFADPVGGWKSDNVVITADEVELGGEGDTRAKLRNGSFELPFYRGANLLDSGQISSNPLDYWVVVSGIHGTIHNPLMMTSSRDRIEGFQSVYFQGGNLDNPVDFPVIFGHHNGIEQHIFDLKFNRGYSLQFDMGAGGLGLTTISGAINVYHEIWHYDQSEKLGVDWQYGSLPPAAIFLVSGMSTFMVDKGGTFMNQIVVTHKKLITLPVAPSADSASMLKINFFLNSGSVHYEGGGKSALQTCIDNVSLIDLVRSDHPFDEPITGRRLDWQSIRMNEGAFSGQGDHLNIDRRYGLITTRRRGNPVDIINKRKPTTLAGVSISGHMDLPRLIHHHPNAADTIFSPGHVVTNSKLLSNGVLVIPSGRALKFEIVPRRTFIIGTDTEVLIAGIWPVAWIVPSGNCQYSGHWYDPGQDSVMTVCDIRYDVVGGGQFTVNRSPIYANNNDLTIKDLRLECFTVVVDPAGSPFGTHWHAADVSIYEIATPFVASGVNATGLNNVGYSSRPGLTYFVPDSTSTFQE